MCVREVRQCAGNVDWKRENGTLHWLTIPDADVTVSGSRLGRERAQLYPHADLRNSLSVLKLSRTQRELKLVSI